MAFFRTVLQIFSKNTLKNPGRYIELFDKREKCGSEIFTMNTRSLWTSRKKSKSKVKCSPCKKLTDNPLVSKGDPSKCLEGQNDVNKKPETCKQQSFWAYLFGEETKISDSVPDPCTCRLAHKFKEQFREVDPRLSDPRYSVTAGDVLLYTELPRPLSSTPTEPQPQPPPPYKIPTAVVCKRISDAIAEHNCVHFCQPKDHDCKGDKCLEPEPFRIPYAEFKPQQRPRSPFTCEDGKRAEDVMQPIRKEMYPCGFSSFSVPNVDPDAKLPKKFTSSPSSSDDECEPNSCKTRKKLSRMERLKKLTAGKQGMYYPLR